MQDLIELLRSASSIVVQVRPGAQITKFREVMADGTLKIDLAAPAEDNQANEELIRFLKEDGELTDVQIVRGITNRRKALRISKTN